MLSALFVMIANFLQLILFTLSEMSSLRALASMLLVNVFSNFGESIILKPRHSLTSTHYRINRIYHCRNNLATATLTRMRDINELQNSIKVTINMSQCQSTSKSHVIMLI